MTDKNKPGVSQEQPGQTGQPGEIDSDRKHNGSGLWYIKKTIKKYGNLAIHNTKEGTTAKISLQGAGK